MGDSIANMVESISSQAWFIAATTDHAITIEMIVFFGGVLLWGLYETRKMRRWREEKEARGERFDSRFSG